MAWDEIIPKQNTLYKTETFKTLVDAHFYKSVPKGSWGRKPNEQQGPKTHQEDRRARNFQRKKVQVKVIYNKTQICYRIQIYRRIQLYRKIQFSGRMVSANENKLGLRPFWSSQHYLARKFAAKYKSIAEYSSLADKNKLDLRPF